MKDMDFSIGNRIMQILDQNEINYETHWSGGLLYILVYNGSNLAMFIAYGFFEEYVIYEQNAQDYWMLMLRNELNFTSIADILKLIGIEMSNE